MADEQQRAVKGLHRLLHPFPAGDIQMVGGLVQNEEVDLLVHQHAKPQAAQLAAGQHADGFEHVLPLKLIGRQTVPGALGRDVLLGVQHGVHQIPLRVVEVDDLLQIRPLHRRAQTNGAAVAALTSCQHIEKRGLAGAVLTDEGDALAALHPQIYVGEQRPFVEGLRHAPKLQHLVALELPAGKAGIHLFGLGGLGGGAHALNALFHAEGPFVEGVVAHEGPQVHLLGGLFQLLDLGLLLQILLHPLLIAALLLYGVEAIVAAVELCLAVQHLDDAGHGAVQEVPVMADGHHRAVKFAEILLQPFRGL